MYLETVTQLIHDQPMQITTWNVNYLNVRLPHLLEYLEQFNPDVMALQETKLPEERIPVDVINADDYRVIFYGPNTYTGVAIASR